MGSTSSGNGASPATFPCQADRRYGRMAGRGRELETYFRLYGPTQSYFGKIWVLPDLEEGHGWQLNRPADSLSL
jgi:hypothetical protein